MEFFNFFPVYIVLVTVFLSTDAQTTGLNIPSDTTKISEKNIVDESKGSSQQNEQLSFQENKGRIEEKALHQFLDSKEKPNKNNTTSKRKSTQVPLGLVIDKKPRTIPIKIPLVIKTGNVKPAPAHYVRLKGSTDRRNSGPKSEKGSNTNKKTPRKKVAEKDKVKSKSTNKSFRKYKPKSLKFFEDKRDSNDKTLLPESKSAKHKKHKKLENRHDSLAKLKSEKHTYNESRHGTYENETGCDCNKTVNNENGRHSILISKLPLSIHYQTECKEANEVLDQTLQGYEPHETPVILPLNELEIMSAPTSDNTTVTVIVNDCHMQDAVNLSDNKYMEPAVRESPIVTVDPENDKFNIESAEVITIKDHNYQEVEERNLPWECPEQINVDEYPSEPLATESLNPASTNLFDTYSQNYQTRYGKYLKHMAESNPVIYNECYFYPRANIPESFYTYTPEVSQIFSSPAKQIVQDIYRPNSGPQSNIINIRPENSVGRIWRTWKDTKIKISKPKYANNKPFQLGRNSNEMNYGEFIAKTPSMDGFQPVSIDKFYNNLNNMWLSPYSCQSNRYPL